MIASQVVELRERQREGVRVTAHILLSPAPAFLGLDEPEATAALSKGQAGKWMDGAEAKCTTVVRDVLAPEIDIVAKSPTASRFQPRP